MQAFSAARSQQTASPAAYRTGRARPAGRHAPPDRPMRSPCRPFRQVAARHSWPCGSYSPHRCWPFLTGRPCRPSWPARPAWQLPARTAEPGTLAGHAAPARPPAWRSALPETVMLSCSPTRRSWSATCRAGGSAGRGPGSGAAAGRSAPVRRMPIRPRLAGAQFLRMAEPSGRR